MRWERINNTDPIGTQVYVRSDNSRSPWNFQTTLYAQINGSSEGFAVALSEDGNTLAAGAPNFGTNQGAVQVYVRSGTTWTYEATLSRLEEASYEGSAVTISADGNTVVAGAPNFADSSSSDFGANQVYVRSGNQWVPQATLTHKMANHEGLAVSLSADGNTLAVGAPGINSGEVVVYSRSGTAWTYQATLSQNITVGSYEGVSVALSGDGSTLAAGLNYATYGATLVYVND